MSLPADDVPVDQPVGENESREGQPPRELIGPGVTQKVAGALKQAEPTSMTP